jgi:broad specificity phosphatase PhoE
MVHDEESASSMKIKNIISKIFQSTLLAATSHFCMVSRPTHGSKQHLILLGFIQGLSYIVSLAIRGRGVACEGPSLSFRSLAYFVDLMKQSFLILHFFVALHWGYVSPFTIPVQLTSIHRLFMAESDKATTESTVIVGPSLPDLAPTSKRLFLVRHGEVINPGGDRAVFYGAMDVSLSPLGKQEATAAAQYLSQFDLEHVFASPLSRAVFGAEEVKRMQANANDLTVTINNGFKELERGAWAGMTKDEIGAETMAKFDACDETVTPEGGESFPFLQTRVLKARDEALDKMGVGKAAAVVSHLQVTRSILSDAKGIPTSEMTKLKVATASITCIDYDMVSGTQTTHFESFKPDIGLKSAKDGAN